MDEEAEPDYSSDDEHIVGAFSANRNSSIQRHTSPGNKLSQPPVPPPRRRRQNASFTIENEERQINAKGGEKGRGSGGDGFVLEEGGRRRQSEGTGLENVRNKYPTHQESRRFSEGIPSQSVSNMSYWRGSELGKNLVEHPSSKARRGVLLNSNTTSGRVENSGVDNPVFTIGSEPIIREDSSAERRRLNLVERAGGRTDALNRTRDDEDQRSSRRASYESVANHRQSSHPRSERRRHSGPAHMRATDMSLTAGMHRVQSHTVLEGSEEEEEDIPTPLSIDTEDVFNHQSPQSTPPHGSSRLPDSRGSHSALVHAENERSATVNAFNDARRRSSNDLDRNLPGRPDRRRRSGVYERQQFSPDFTPASSPCVPNLNKKRRSSGYASLTVPYDEIVSAGVEEAHFVYPNGDTMSVHDGSTMSGKDTSREPEDLAELEFLDHDNLLEQLERRFRRGQPYVSENIETIIYLFVCVFVCFY
jgi:hypothetical protein